MSTIKRCKKTYSITNLMNALQDVKDGKYNTTTAAKIHNVPRQTLADKVKGKSPASFCKPGPHPLLGLEIEQNLRDWAVQNAASGLITTKDSIIFSVRKIIESNSNAGMHHYFQNRTLGTGWYKAFKKRYPEIVLTKLANFKYPQISKPELQAWFRKVRKTLGKNGEILLDPDRIFCMGQLPLAFNSVSKNGDTQIIEKDTANVLFTVNVEAKLAPAMIYFKHFPSAESDSDHTIRQSTYVCVSTGKSQCRIFYDYMVDVFYPYLVNSNIEFPIVLFVDPRAAHVSFALQKFCEEKGIHMIPFLPNVSNLHPLENGFFPLFFETWKTEVKFWPARNNNKDMQEKDIETVVSNVIQFTVFTNTVKQAFRKCGLFPFDSNAIDFDTIDYKKPQPVYLRTYQYHYKPVSNPRVELTKSKESNNEPLKIEKEKSLENSSEFDPSSVVSIAEHFMVEDFIEETIEDNQERNNSNVECSDFDPNYQSVADEISSSPVPSSPTKRKHESSSDNDTKRIKIEVLTNMAEKSEPDLNINVENIVAAPDDSPDILKKKNKDLQGLLEKVIDLLKEKSNVCLNLEKQNSALNLQILSLKDIVSITKNLLSIRNVEVENMQKDMSSLQDKINAEKERHNKMIETIGSANKLNEDIKGEYQNQMSLFQQLRDKYNEKVALLTQENQKLKTEIQNLKNQPENVVSEST